MMFINNLLDTEFEYEHEHYSTIKLTIYTTLVECAGGRLKMSKQVRNMKNVKWQILYVHV